MFFCYYLEVGMEMWLQRLAVGAWVLLLSGGPTLGFSLAAFFTCCSSLWWLTIAYLLFIYLDDSKNTGSRR